MLLNITDNIQRYFMLIIKNIEEISDQLKV